MSRYLEMVDHPSHVKKLTPEQLTELAADIRQELIEGLAKSGGHPVSYTHLTLPTNREV